MSDSKEKKSLGGVAIFAWILGLGHTLGALFLMDPEDGGMRNLVWGLLLIGVAICLTVASKSK